MAHLQKQNNEFFRAVWPDNGFGIKREEEVDSDAKIPNTFKDAVSLFIHENKKLPTRWELVLIAHEHLPQPEPIENLWGSFNKLEALEEALGPGEWKQEYEQEWVMDKGDVIDNGAIGTVTVGGAGTTEFKDVDFTTYISSDAASESALGSAKGINKYNLDHPGI